QAPAREGADIRDASGRVIGRVTSGGYSPSLAAPIAMGYVDTAFAADETSVSIFLRERPRAANVAPMPFVPHRYKRSGS
ncbi:MAG TPA: glycine cleavage T C-terminal barrel domain-containing protein, partial [Micropepsaceae bacterium]